MLRYPKILLVSVGLLMLAGITDYFTGISLWWYAGIILVTIGILAYGSVYIHSGFYTAVICFPDRDEKVIALTFDDGPDERVTPRVLDVLKSHGIGAAFFCVGSKVFRYPEIIGRMDAEGHIIGGHTYSHHTFFDLFSVRKMTEEMTKTEKIIRRIIRKKIRMFRPVYGVTNPMLAKALNKMNYTAIGWSLRSRDTVIHDGQKLFDRLTGRLGKSEIILLHDTKMHMVPVLDKFIIFAKENHYRFERLDKLTGIEAYE